MKKVLNIAWKDLLVVFRDPAALVLMLVTPFALTLAIAFAFGRLTGGGGGGTGLSDIPVMIVNHDPGQFGQTLVQVFESEELADLVEPTLMDDDEAARAVVDADEAAAVVIIPADLTESILPEGLARGDFSTAVAHEQSVIEVYSSPMRPIGSGVVRGIVDRFLSQVAAGAAAGQVSVTQLVVNGLISPQTASELGQTVGQRAGEQATRARPIVIKDETATGSRDNGFDWMGYMAPSMAIMFLMFTVSAGGRSILAERDAGTLPRMLTTPTTAAQVLGGKVFGTYLTGLAQLFVLIAASGLLFGVKWGDPVAVVLLALILVAAATSWGVLIAACSRTPGQVNAVGSTIALIFAAAAGNFIPRQSLPEWLRFLSYISPNAWGLEGFGELAAGGSLAEIVVPVVALLVMAVILFGVSIVAFRRQYA